MSFKQPRTVLRLEELEHRLVPSISTVLPAADTLVASLSEDVNRGYSSALVGIDPSTLDQTVLLQGGRDQLTGPVPHYSFGPVAVEANGDIVYDK